VDTPTSPTPDTAASARANADRASLNEARSNEGDNHLARISGALAPALEARYGRGTRMEVISRSTWTSNEGPVTLGHQWLATARLTGEHANKRAVVELVRADDTKTCREEVWLRFLSPDDRALDQAWIVTHPDVGEVQVVQRASR
jgi:hypothetical protein